MSGIVMTAYQGMFLKWISIGLGKILNLIYETIGFHHVILSILIITILIYMCLLPLTIKQQKFAKLQQKMQPEIQKIQEKYKGKKDNASMQAQNEETQLIYQKYGVSPTGSCVQLLIQMPLLLALYRVFNNIPAYIVDMKDAFSGIVSEILASSNYSTTLSNIVTDNNIITSSGLKASNVQTILDGASGTDLKNYIIDILYKIPSDVWTNLNSKKLFNGSLSSTTIDTLTAFLKKTNYFLSLNISDTPGYIIKTNFASHSYLLVILALLIPVLSYLTQLGSIKMMPTNSTGANDQMAQNMKTMNFLMPLISFVFCFNVPVALGLYWIFSAVVRICQQFFINRHLKNLDLDELIEKNMEKAKKKAEKQGISSSAMREAAAINTRSLSSRANSSSKAELELELSAANEKKANAAPGSMAAKANMVKTFNEKNSNK